MLDKQGEIGVKQKQMDIISTNYFVWQFNWWA